MGISDPNHKDWQYTVLFEFLCLVIAHGFHSSAETGDFSTAKRRLPLFLNHVEDIYSENFVNSIFRLPSVSYAINSIFSSWVYDILLTCLVALLHITSNPGYCECYMLEIGDSVSLPKSINVFV